MSGRNQWIRSTGYISPDTLNRNVLVSQNNPRKRLPFHVLESRFLDLGKVAHLSLSKFDVAYILLCQLCKAFLDLCLGQPEARRVPVVELL
jgi:hypothetical protein